MIPLHDVLSSSLFTFKRYEQTGRRGDQSLARLEIAAPLWMWTGQTITLAPSDFRSWEAYFANWSGGLIQTGGSTDHQRPLNYPDAYPGSFAGTGSALIVNPSQLQIYDTPTGFTLRAGDHVEVNVGPSKQLIQVKADVGRDGNGHINASVTGPRMVMQTGATVTYNLNSPGCDMELLSYEIGEYNQSYRTITFEALQVPRKN